MKKHAAIDYYIQLALIITLLISIVLSFTGVYFLREIWMMIYLSIGGVQLLSLAAYFSRYRNVEGQRKVYAIVVLIQIALLIVGTMFDYVIVALIITLLFISPIQLIGYFVVTREWYQKEKLHDALYLR